MTYNLELFEQLNAEYASMPLVPAPPQLGSVSRTERAEKLVGMIGKTVPLKRKVVLEFGCGTGHLSQQILRRAGARQVIGVDVRSYPSWEEMVAQDGLDLRMLDVTTEAPAPPASVDTIVSLVVFEHVHEPVLTLAALAELLVPGGRMHLKANLYAGPSASHRYREVYFPWPHLLFDDDVGREFYRRHHKRNATFSWVNKMTLGHYVLLCAELGLRVVSARRAVKPIDVPFYARFQERLGRWSALDLETNFVTLVLERGTGPIAPLDYVSRQRELDDAVAALAMA